MKIMINLSEFMSSKEFLGEINQTYNSNLKEVWTCENFWLSPLDYYPNWNMFKGRSAEEVHKIIDDFIATKKDNGIDKIDAVAELEKNGLIIFFHDKGLKTNEIRGFTKVQGNEFNSMLILKTLVQLSKQIPKATIEISDEGKYLLCPLKIKNGKALPLIKDVVQDMKLYALRLIFAKDSQYNIIDKLKNANGFTEYFKNDLHINNPYGELDIKYIDEKLADLKIIEKKLQKVLKERNTPKHMLYFYNLQKISPKDWFNPDLFTRHVVVEDFLNYKMSTGTLMDGFNGEGFGLSDEDSEKTSYEMLAKLGELFSNNDFNMKILGED